MNNSLELTTQYTDTYQIQAGYNIGNDIIGFLQRNYNHNKALVVIDQNVYNLHGKELIKSLEQVYDKVPFYVVKSGEESKSIGEFSAILDFVLSQHIERKTPLIAVGGGVTGDLAGFVAASALRGIPLIHLPTTLLAMVDSSIGGKTGINHKAGKNLIGAFYQPKAVFADLKFLDSLPKKEWVGGLSEILKYGFISDKTIFETTTKLIEQDKDFKNTEEWLNVVKSSMSIKADIVAKDVKENGLREFLNFGHTFAHVLERVGNYKKYTHGEAVFMGMLAAIFVSNKLGAGVDENLLLRYKYLYNLKVEQTLDSSSLTDLMLLDKKTKNKEIRLVLLKETEKPYTKNFDDTTVIKEAWDYILKEFS